MDKKVKVVMLATQNGSKIHKNNLGNLYTTPNKASSVVSTDHHIYLFEKNGNYEIGDYVFDVIDKIIVQVTEESCLTKDHHLIIASTDESLNLPRPSDSFIQKYIEEYNKGSKLMENLLFNLYMRNWKEVM